MPNTFKRIFKRIFFCTKKYHIQCDKNAFLNKSLPIICLMGPPGCRKTTLARMLSKSSNYYLFNVQDLVLEEMVKGKASSKIIMNYISDDSKVPDDILLTLIKEAIAFTYEDSQGYIFDDFPLSIRQLQLFEKEICKVNVIIYVNVILEATLSARVNDMQDCSPNEERLLYIRSNKRLKRIAKKYHRKTITFYSTCPLQYSYSKLLDTLESIWGYKF